MEIVEVDTYYGLEHPLHVYLYIRQSIKSLKDFCVPMCCEHEARKAKREPIFFFPGRSCTGNQVDDVIENLANHLIKCNFCVK